MCSLQNIDLAILNAKNTISTCEYFSARKTLYLPFYAQSKADRVLSPYSCLQQKYSTVWAFVITQKLDFYREAKALSYPAWDLISEKNG